MNTVVLVLSVFACVAEGGVFTRLGEKPPALEGPMAVGTPGPRPVRGSVLEVDVAELVRALSAAPAQRLDAALQSYGAIVQLPHPEIEADGAHHLDPAGGLVECFVAESPVMEPGLAAKFPEFRTYLVRSRDGRANGRLELTPRGLTAMLRTPEGTWMIDLWQSGDPRHAVVYWLHDLPGGGDWTCETTPGVHGPDDRVEHSGAFESRALQTARTVRLAVACTGEYALHHSALQGHAPNAVDPLAAIVTVVSRTNVVYEGDLGVHFNLVANNHLLMFTNPATDPYDTTCSGTGGTDCSGNLLAPNISTLASIIGNPNYDVGHVVTRIFGGVAYLGAVCGSNKGGGVSGIPRGGDIDPFSALVVIHELGHQFGANHTFSGTRGRCQGNVRLASAWEAGSGSSPMAYAGGCPVGDAPPSDNVAIFADPYFHHGSVVEMRAFLSSVTCPVSTTSGNDVPVISFTTANTSIPPETPFVLSALATDVNGDVLTYSWEEFDSGVARPLSGTGSEDNGQGALFRIFPPVLDDSRTFPAMSDVLSGVATPGERLPTVTGVTRRFRVIVRDNVAGAGASVVSGFTDLSIANGASAFAVTSPSAGTVLHPGPATVSWSVGNTNNPPISCASVSISLSIDDGGSFTIPLGTFPNTGSASVVLPDVVATSRVRVDGVGEIFFAISPAFEIAEPCVADVDDGSGTGTPDNGVTIDDLVYYLTIFESGNGQADVDDGSGTGTPDGGVTIDDLIYYLTRFEAGC